MKRILTNQLFNEVVRNTSVNNKSYHQDVPTAKRNNAVDNRQHGTRTNSEQNNVAYSRQDGMSEKGEKNTAVKKQEGYNQNYAVSYQ